jgi:hypothetical protein
MELDLTCQTQLYLGFFEREVYKWVGRLSTGINCAIDIGAGEGEYAIYFLARTTAKKVFAFEPYQISRSRLVSNLALNGLANNNRLNISTKFVGSSDDESTCTLDLLSFRILSPALIKIDVDGGEVDILRNASGLIDRSDIRWIVETHSQQLEEECIRIFNMAGYITTVVHNAWYRLFISELRPSPQNRWLVAARKTDGKD